MVLSKLGRDVDEESLLIGRSGSKRGYPLEDAASWISGTYRELDPDEARNYEYLRVTLLSGGWMIAAVFAKEIGRHAESLAEPPLARWSPLSHDLGLHAVVLIDVFEGGFSYFDPYYEGNGQPLLLPNVVFAKAWTGAIVVAPTRLS